MNLNKHPRGAVIVRLTTNTFHESSGYIDLLDKLLARTKSMAGVLAVASEYGGEKGLSYEHIAEVAHSIVEKIEAVTILIHGLEEEYSESN